MGSEMESVWWEYVKWDVKWREYVKYGVKWSVWWEYVKWGVKWWEYVKWGVKWRVYGENMLSEYVLEILRNVPTYVRYRLINIYCGG